MTLQTKSTAADYELGSRIHRLYRRAHAMGLLEDDPDLASWDRDELTQAAGRVLHALKGAGIGRSAPDFPASAFRSGPRRYVAYLDEILDALEDSPSPRAEIRTLADLFDWDGLSGFAGASPQSLRRYASGERGVPDEVAQRVHWLTGVVADLRAAYNDAGVRRWFERPRPSFNGRSPSAFLVPPWTPDDLQVARIREFAARFAEPTPAT